MINLQKSTCSFQVLSYVDFFVLSFSLNNFAGNRVFTSGHRVFILKMEKISFGTSEQGLLLPLIFTFFSKLCLFVL